MHTASSRNSVLSLVFVTLILVSGFVAFSTFFYSNTDVRSRAMDTASFRSLLIQKGVQLPSPLPVSMTEAEYAQLAQFAGITTSEAKKLFSQLKAEEASGSATIIQPTTTPVPTAGPTPSISPIIASPIPTTTQATRSAIISPTSTPEAQQITSTISNKSEDFAVTLTTADEPPVTEGTLQVLHIDNFEDPKQSGFRYYIYDRLRQKKSELASLDGIEIVPGSRISVTGEKDPDGTLRVRDASGIQTIQKLVSPGEISPDGLMTPQSNPTTGALKAIVVLIDFANNRTSTPTVTTARDHVNGQLNSFLQENSWGKTSISGDAVGWYHSTANLTCDLDFLGAQAVAAANPYVDFRQYTHLIVVHPGCTWGGIGYVGGDGISFSTRFGTVRLHTTGVRNDNYGLRVTSHELGHNFGVWHANGWDCGTESDYGTCTSIGYADHWEAMGSNQPYHFDGFHKQRFGWLGPNAIQTVTTSGRYTIQPIENSTTLPQVLKIKRDASTSYYVESKVATGFDSSIPANAVNGALLRWVPTIIEGGDTHLIDSTPNSSTDAFGDLTDANWPIGKTFVDKRQGLQITPVSKSNGVLTVDVTFLQAPIGIDPIGISKVFTSVTPKFSWQAVVGASQYQIQIARDSAFSSVISTTTVNTAEYTPVAGLPEGVPIYWRVRSLAPTVASPWSLTFVFTSANPPTTPVLSLPATNTLSQIQNVALTWKASTTPVPDHYEIQISTKTGVDFDSNIVDSNTSIPATTLTFTTKSLPRVATYYWRVRAVSAKGELSPWSAIWIFKVAPSSPTLVSPANGATTILTSTPKLDWSDVPGATNYYIQVARNSTFGTLVVNKLIGSTLSEFTTPALVEGVPIYWRVYAVSTVGNSGWSSAYSFTSANPPSTPVLKTPATNTLVQTNAVTLTWGASTAPVPDHYEVQVSTKTGVDFDSGIVDSNIAIASPTLSYTTKVLPRANNYYWRVRSVGTDSTTSTWSTIWLVKIAPDKPTLVSPINGSRNILTSTPTFDWSDVTGATNYFIQASLASTMASPFFNQLTGGTTSSWTATKAIAEGKIVYWRAYAVSAVGNGTWSDIFTFNSADAPTAPVGTAPTNASLQQIQNIPLTWKASTAPTPVRYEVQVATDTAFTQIVDTNANVPATLTTVTYTTATLPRVATYYWRVRGVSDIGVVGLWSAALSFKIASSTPILISPTNGSSSVKSLTPTFDWSDVSGATNYYIQASTVSTFASAISGYNGLIGSTTSSYIAPSTRPLPANKTIYWRVYSVSTVGNSAWSSVFSFTSPPAPPTVPVLSTPASGTTIIGLVPTVTWKASTPSLAVSYDVELSTVGGTTFDTGIIQTRKNLTSLTTSFSSVNPGTTYYWRVKAYNSAGIYSVSAVWSFKTRPQLTVRLENIKYGSVPDTGLDGFSFDAIDEDGSITDDTSSRFAYYFGTGYPHWNRITNGGTWNSYYGGSSNLTRSASDYVEFQTTATNLKMYTRKSNSFGKVDVFVNGVKKTTLTNNVASGDTMQWVSIPL